MAHSLSLLGLKKHLKKAIFELKNDNPELLNQLIESNSRRNFLKSTSLAMSGILVGSTLLNFGCSLRDEKKYVAILGGGIAGLTAAYELQKLNIPYKIFEADKRVGGRIKTKRDFVSGLTTECGAEFVDTTHLDLLNYLKEFNINKIDIRVDKLIKDSFFYNGKMYSEKEIVAAYKKILPKIIIDQVQSEKDEKYAEKIDYTSLDVYFTQLNGDEWFIECLKKAYESEYGGNIGEQSATNFLSMMLPEVGEQFEVFGVSDEVIKIKGGTQTLVEAFEKRINNINLNHKLKKIKQLNNQYILEFENGTTVEAPFVLCTIPFTVLKNIEIDIKNMTESKKRCIQELGYGTNIKYIQKFNDKPWRNNGYQGFLFNNIIHNGFDSSQLQNDNIKESTYTFYFGGDDAMEFCKKENFESLRTKYLDYFDTVFKGAKAEVSSEANNYLLLDWPNNPLAKCSYSSFKPGQWTLYGEEVSKPIDNLFFAGEHCSDDFQGFMNGAIQTSKIATASIIKAILKK
jgi:monoamine oxidase